MFIFNDFFAAWHSLYNQPGWGSVDYGSLHSGKI